MARVFNFSAGPAGLPTEVLEQIQAEMLDWHGMGASVMEISHRSPEFVELAATIKANFKKALNVPDTHDILFLHGGGRHQFSMVPMNLLALSDARPPVASYAVTGNWSKAAMTEAAHIGAVSLACDAKDSSYTTIPDINQWNIDESSAYLHYCDNETVYGLEFDQPPQFGDLPIVADLSSNILSRQIDVSRFGLIYACAQKNMGPSGITVVIVRKDLMGHALPNTPDMLNYQINASKDSMQNTPPTFAWYVLGLVVDWVLAQGGVAAVEAKNQRNADSLYRAIDASSLYHNNVDPRYRSRMNAVFTLSDDNLTSQFVSETREAGLYGLKGHRSVGGIRASIYNAMPEAGVAALIRFMQEFERKHG